MARGTRHANKRNYFEQADLSVHMLGLPQSRRRFGKWGLFAILAGTILAAGVIVLGNYFASLF